MNQFDNHPLYKRHNIDSAMSALWDFYKSRFISLFIISLVMSLFISYASSFIDLKDIQSTTDPMEILGKLKNMIVPILIVSLISLLFTTIFQHYILVNPVDSSNSIFLSIVRSLKFFIPYLIILILFSFFASIAIVLGLLLFVIGAFFALLYIMTIYLFILPVLMVEGASIGNAIARTFSLAHRNFWSNIGWVAVFLILLIVISVILSGIMLIPFSGSFFRTLMNPGEASKILDMATSPLFIWLSALASALTFPLLPVFSLILYFNGRADEEKKTELVNTDKDTENKLRVEDLYSKPYADDHPDNPDKKV
jgi:hypothetical protein